MRDLTFVTCRFVALGLAVYSLAILPAAAMMSIAWFMSEPSPHGPDIALISLATILHPLVLLCVGGALWFAAERVAARVVPPTMANESLGITRDELVAVVFAGVGVFLLATGVSDLVGHGYERWVLRQHGLSTPQLTETGGALMSAGVKTVAGLFLLFGGSGLVGAIRRFRTLGDR